MIERERQDREGSHSERRAALLSMQLFAHVVSPGLAPRNITTYNKSRGKKKISTPRNDWVLPCLVRHPGLVCREDKTTET